MITRTTGLFAAMCSLLGSFLSLPSHAAAADDAAPQPIELPGIHNAFRVTDRILAGSQPVGAAVFAALANAGVKTIISVDGSRPDLGAAKRHGLRYVHLPFGYDGIPASRIAELVKAAAPASGKLFIHCHHGKHRGPAAAAVICQAVAGWSRTQADSWLKQAGTAADYPGLYRAVREFVAPTPEKIALLGELPEIAKTSTMVDTMVAIDERFDALKSAQAAGWKTPSVSAESSPAHHATLLWEQLRELARHDDAATRPDNFRKLLADSERNSAVLRETLRTSPADTVKLDATMKQITQSCIDCHKAYRNETQ